MSHVRARLRRALAALHLGWMVRVWRWLANLDPRRLRRQALFRRWNRGAAADEMVVRPGLRLRIDPQSREPFEWFCFRSLEMARELDAFRRELPARRRFLDVGACHGIFSLAFAHRHAGALALAIEPSGLAYPILMENIRRCGLDNVISRQVACGAAAGTLRMRQVWHHLEAQTAGAPNAPDIVAVAMRSVDELCAELEFQPDLVKIDVEGYEVAVLAGARATLARCRPPLFLEIHPDALRNLGGSAGEVVQLLASLGYRLFGLDGRPLSRRRVAGRSRVSRIFCAAG